jgi:hypothetical protein
MYFDELRKRWFADWRDKRGKRHRHAFTSQKAAQAFEGEMKAAHPKNNSTRTQAAISSSRISGADGNSSSFNRSSRSSVVCIQDGSRQRTLSQQKRPSKRAGGRR